MCVGFPAGVIPLGWTKGKGDNLGVLFLGWFCPLDQRECMVNETNKSTNGKKNKTI